MVEVYSGLTEVHSGLVEVYSGLTEVYSGLMEVYFRLVEVYSGLMEVYFRLPEVHSGRKEANLNNRNISKLYAEALHLPPANCILSSKSKIGVKSFIP